MNAIWSTIVADFKTGIIDLETMLGKLWATVEGLTKGLPGLIWNLVSTDANTLVQDFGPDLQAIVTNIQNNTTGLSLANFPALFQQAILPILEQEALKLKDEDWTIITAYYAANNKITATPANNGNLPQGESNGS